VKENTDARVADVLPGESGLVPPLDGVNSALFMMLGSDPAEIAQYRMFYDALFSSANQETTYTYMSFAGGCQVAFYKLQVPDSSRTVYVGHFYDPYEDTTNPYEAGYPNDATPDTLYVFPNKSWSWSISATNKKALAFPIVPVPPGFVAASPSAAPVSAPTTAPAPTPIPSRPPVSPSSSFVVPSFALGVTAVILSVAVLIIIILIFLEVRRRSRLGA
jgi:hypothetical protein